MGLPRITGGRTRIIRHIVIDAIIIGYAYAITLFFRALANPVAVVESISVFVFGGIMLLAMLYAFGVYQRLWKHTSGYEVTIIVKAVTLATILIGAYVFLRQIDWLHMPMLVVGNMLAMVGFVMVRYRSRLISGLSWRWYAARKRELAKTPTRVLIIGAGDAGQTLAWRLKHRFNNTRYHIVGFIDDDPTKQDMFLEGCRILGTRHDIVRLTEALGIDLIAVALHNVTGPDFREILTLCERTNALIKVVPDLQAMVSATRTSPLLRDVTPEDLIGRSPITRHAALDFTPVTSKTVLITGAAGSIGSELCRQMPGYTPTRLILLDNNESGLNDLMLELRAQHPHLSIVPALADITNPRSLRAVFTKYRPQVVFHAAAYKHVPMLEYYPEEALRVNIGGTKNLVDLSCELGVERFVLISTDKAVNPSSIMGATKRICELLLQATAQHPDNRMVFASVRFGNVLGSRGSVVPIFNRQIDAGGPVTVTHREMTRYFMSIPEAVNLIIHAACMTKGKDVFILKMGEVVRIVELAERIIRLRGLRPYKDIAIEFTGVRPGEKLHEELYYAAETPLDTMHPSILQLRPTDLEIDADGFWSRLSTLMQNISSDPQDVLCSLRNVIQPQSSTAMSVE